MAEHGGYFYSDTWYTFHPRRCGALHQLKPTENPSYNFAEGEWGKWGESRGVVACFHGSIEEATTWLDTHRHDPPDVWKYCGACGALVKRSHGT
jgi:hypothetical protein